MIVVGVVLLLIGILVGIPILFWIGVALAVVGAFLLLAQSTGRTVGPRRYYY